MTRRASAAGMFAATRAIFPFSTATSSAPRRFCDGSITLPPFSTRSYMASLLRSACRWRESTRVRATRSSHHEHDGEDHHEEPGRELDQSQRRPDLADRTARLQDPSLKGRRPVDRERGDEHDGQRDRKSTRLNSSHLVISYAVFCLKKKKKKNKNIYIKKKKKIKNNT